VNKNSPLGLPVGSVRSLLVIGLVVALILVAVAFAARVVIGAPEEVIERSFDLVLGALIGASNLALAFYFGSRTPAATK
jgi:hypothetical protein